MSLKQKIMNYAGIGAMGLAGLVGGCENISEGDLVGLALRGYGINAETAGQAQATDIAAGFAEKMGDREHEIESASAGATTVNVNFGKSGDIFYINNKKYIVGETYYSGDGKMVGEWLAKPDHSVECVAVYPYSQLRIKKVKEGNEVSEWMGMAGNKFICINQYKEEN